VKAGAGGAADERTEAHPSGAPEAGGATSRGSFFGGATLEARVLRALARMSRAVEAAAYRRLRDLDRGIPETQGFRGRPHRVREAFTHATPPPWAGGDLEG
jgi:hypothetical protein